MSKETSTTKKNCSDNWELGGYNKVNWERNFICEHYGTVRKIDGMWH